MNDKTTSKLSFSINYIPTSRCYATSYSNKMLTQRIVHLFEPAKAILAHLEERNRQRAKARANLNLRNAPVDSENDPDAFVMNVLQELVDIGDKVN